MITIDKGIVSRWKIDTKFEHWLSYQADKSDFFKRLYCRYYALVDRDYYVKGIEMAKQTMKDFYAQRFYREGHSEKKFLQDMIYCLHRFGFSYEEYFLFELYNKNTTGKDAYISDKMRYEYYYYLNSQEGIKLLRDKGKTYELLGQFFKRDCAIIYSKDDLPQFCEFTEKHSHFLYKPIGLDCGRGVREIDATDFDVDSLFIDLLKDGAFIAEELIVQSEDIAKFHPQSVNTVRVATIVCKDGIHVPYAVFRMGRGGSTVDNAGSGGVFASVDPESGIVISKAVLERSDKQFIFHPDTGEKILGFQLPEWNQSVQLIKEMATLVPGMRYIGWDLAHTDNGWVLVEANGSGQFLGQMADKIGIKHKFLELMKNI